MTYAPEEIGHFRREFDRITVAFDNLGLRCISAAQDVPNDDVRRFLNHGVARRLGVLKRSLEEIYSLFPPNRADVLPLDDIALLQIYLHAFVINLSGLFDNFAWAFVHRHGLRGELRPMQIGIFRPETQRYLPEPILECLTEHGIPAWHSEYAKEYRDALAHRVPLYVPPASMDDEEQVEHQRLQEERLRLIAAGEFERENEARDWQMQLGSPCFYFLHDIDPDQDAELVWMHPQLLCDTATVIEFGNRFFDSWHTRAG